LQARDVLARAEVLAASARYHTLISDTDIGAGCVRLISQKGFTSLAEQFQRYQNKRIVVLTAGDPMHFGAGSALARRLGTTDIAVIPKPSAFSLACARMVWSVPDSETLTIHASHPAGINLYVYPDAQIVALGAGGGTPGQIARYLCERGFSESRITVFCDMGDTNEHAYEAMAKSWSYGRVSDLNTICVKCIAGPDARWWSRVPGLPVEAFGYGAEEVAAPEIRASILSALAPQPGDTLWGMGGGSGAIGIEWLRSTLHTRAAVFEEDDDQRMIIEKNSEFLGTPHLHILKVEDFSDQKAPNAIFLTGFAVSEDRIRVCHDLLKPGGRLVAVCPEQDARDLNVCRSSIGGGIVEIRVNDETLALYSLTL